MSTYGDSVISTSGNDFVACTHEEADTRIMIHVADCASQGHTKVCIRTVDTDVVALAVSVLNTIALSELWLAFGAGKSFRYIAAHSIASNLGRDKAAALPMFHSITGCDTVSSFAGRGKKSCWDVWRMYEPLTQCLLRLTDAPAELTTEDISVIQRFVVLLYGRTCELSTVNEARRHLFAQGSRSLEHIPPTQGALLQHCKRAVYQGGYIWGQALVPDPTLPSPANWGWRHDGDGWQPHWTDLPEAASACHELIRCGCNKACSGHCKCKRNALA